MVEDEDSEEFGEMDDVVEIPLTIEFYLRHRDDPILVEHVIGIPRAAVAEIDAENIMAYAVVQLLEGTNTRSESRCEFRNGLGGLQVIMVDEIQSFSMHAITEETIQRAVRNHHAD